MIAWDRGRQGRRHCVVVLVCVALVAFVVVAAVVGVGEVGDVGEALPDGVVTWDEWLGRWSDGWQGRPCKKSIRA